MKKYLYIIGAFLLGVVVASSAGTVSAQVKSMIGQKVTGEYTVFVNGKELIEKGAVIDGKTNVPLRSIADALGVDIQVTGKTINITSTVSSTGDDSGNGKVVVLDGKYYTKYELLNKKKDIEEKIEGVKESNEERKKKYELEKASGDVVDEYVWLAGFAEAEKKISEYESEISKINEALKQFD